MKSLSAGFDSSCSGASFEVLNASRRFENSDDHIDPSVSSFKCGASAGRNVGPDLPGSIPGGVNTVLAIKCFASERSAASPAYPSRIVRHFFSYFNNIPGLPPVCLLPRHTALSFQKTFYKQSPSCAQTVGRTCHRERLIRFHPRYLRHHSTPDTIEVWRKLHFCDHEAKRNECRTHPRRNPNQKH
jgi:hypothetical protein